VEFEDHFVERVALGFGRTRRAEVGDRSAVAFRLRAEEPSLRRLRHRRERVLDRVEELRSEKLTSSGSGHPRMFAQATRNGTTGWREA